MQNQRPSQGSAAISARGGVSAPRQSGAYTLGILVAIYAISFIDRSILYVVAPSVQADLKLNDTQLGLLSGLAFALFYATMSLPIARIAERTSRVQLMTGALLLWSLMTGLCGAATKFWHLFLARLGVGLGEGTCTPCAQSIICDLYPPERRATALSIYAAGAPIGMMAGAIGGAIAASALGWRGAFVAAAIPGIMVAFLFLFTVKEPRRGAREPGSYVDSASPPSFPDVVRTLWRSPSFRHTTLGYAVGSIPGTAIHIFAVIFLVRAHGMSQVDAGVAYGLVAGIAGTIGVVLGGRITDYFCRRSVRAYGLVPAIAFLILPPLLIAAFVQENLLVMTALILIPSVIYIFNVGPSYAVTNNLVEPRMRATTNAMLLMIITFCGSAIGPALVGLASDHIASWSLRGDAGQCAAALQASAKIRIECAQAASDGLRYAMMAISLLYFWGAAHYFRLSSVISRELHEIKSR
ncbi:spinster family MFS transporter [Sphingobium fuliginis]|uniref:Major facilitator family transporter n=1 Tax=Sphingobium fuliginis (strain ATCC 27551) TaxID=336203 RepID=A0A292ZH08_SPHSA|nr:MFS transporter [Sphingobium fuliginis]GAY22216.1 major facilitator family transporter [Sphingobium fuliginis]